MLFAFAWAIFYNLGMDFGQICLGINDHEEVSAFLYVVC